eukprot:3985143-Pyramimonas_sp.AAC.1
MATGPRARRVSATATTTRTAAMATRRPRRARRAAATMATRTATTATRPSHRATQPCTAAVAPPQVRYPEVPPLGSVLSGVTTSKPFVDSSREYSADVRLVPATHASTRRTVP